MPTKPLLAPAFAAYWFIFWLLNGLDKFFYATPIGNFAWHGKDRHEQFERYFSNIGIPNAPIEGIFAFAGVTEILVALPFLICGPLLLSNNLETWLRGARTMHLGLICTFAVFLGFIFLDVIAGDRAELLEHSTYLVVIAAAYCVTYLDHMLIERSKA